MLIVLNAQIQSKFGGDNMTRFWCLIFTLCLSSATALYSHDDYMFDYRVHSNENNENQNFGQHELRNQDQTTGEYFVTLPDGRIQRVRYYVDKYSGFVADVTYEGVAKTYNQAPAPVPAPYRFYPYGR